MSIQIIVTCNDHALVVQYLERADLEQKCMSDVCPVT